MYEFVSLCFVYLDIMNSLTTLNVIDIESGKQYIMKT